ncbi:MAG: FixH family protein [Gallionella sp.]
MFSQQNKDAWRNPWFLGMVCIVATAVLVNSVFIWYALHGRSTLVDYEYDTKDRKSDTETIDNIQAQQELAWKFTIKLPKTVVIGTPAPFQIDVADSGGVPVGGEMEVVAYRASDASKDFSIPFTQVSSGKYQGYISFPLKGYWELHIRVTRGKNVFDTESNKIMVSEAGSAN